MSGWRGQLCKHTRCSFNHSEGIAAVRARTYAVFGVHQWVCAYPRHEVHAFPPCTHRALTTPGSITGGRAQVETNVQPVLF
jgi:hypothetical protein